MSAFAVVVVGIKRALAVVGSILSQYHHLPLRMPVLGIFNALLNLAPSVKIYTREVK